MKKLARLLVFAFVLALPAVAQDQVTLSKDTAQIYKLAQSWNTAVLSVPADNLVDYDTAPVALDTSKFFENKNGVWQLKAGSELQYIQFVADVAASGGTVAPNVFPTASGTNTPTLLVTPVSTGSFNAVTPGTGNIINTVKQYAFLQSAFVQAGGQLSDLSLNWSNLEEIAKEGITVTKTTTTKTGLITKKTTQVDEAAKTRTQSIAQQILDAAKDSTLQAAAETINVVDPITGQVVGKVSELTSDGGILVETGNTMLTDTGASLGSYEDTGYSTSTSAEIMGTGDDTAALSSNMENLYAQVDAETGNLVLKGGVSINETTVQPPNAPLVGPAGWRTADGKCYGTILVPKTCSDEVLAKLTEKACENMKQEVDLHNKNAPTRDDIKDTKKNDCLSKLAAPIQGFIASLKCPGSLGDKVKAALGAAAASAAGVSEASASAFVAAAGSCVYTKNPAHPFLISQFIEMMFKKFLNKMCEIADAEFNKLLNRATSNPIFATVSNISGTVTNTISAPSVVVGQ